MAASTLWLTSCRTGQATDPGQIAILSYTGKACHHPAARCLYAA